MTPRSFFTDCKIFVLLVLIVSNTAFADESLKLEITLVDNENPTQSVAIINGESVKQSDTISGFEIISISASNATVKNLQTGEERVLVPMPAEPPKTESLAAAPVSDTPAPQKEKHALTDFLKAPKKLINRFWELRGIRDLVTVNNAAVSYYNVKSHFPKTFDDLIQANFLAAQYQSGIREKYRFYLVVPTEAKGFGVHGDPLDSASGLRSFFVGTDAVVRESAEGPAGPKSSPHAY